jgi:hypothetical protein
VLKTAAALVQINMVVTYNIYIYLSMGVGGGAAHACDLLLPAAALVHIDMVVGVQVRPLVRLVCRPLADERDLNENETQHSSM